MTESFSPRIVLISETGRGTRATAIMDTMATNTAEALYEVVLQLSVSERLRLVEKIAHDLSALLQPVHPPFDWAQLAGAAPGLLGGEDAQTWVSQSRQESDDAREQLLRRKP